MNSRFTVVETSLNQAEFRWKWLKFLQHSFLLGGILCALVLLFGGAILYGWVTSKALATTFFALLGMVGFIAWAVIIISVMAGAPDRSWLAAARAKTSLGGILQQRWWWWMVMLGLAALLLEMALAEMRQERA